MIKKDLSVIYSPMDDHELEFAHKTLILDEEQGLKFVKIVNLHSAI